VKTANIYDLCDAVIRIEEPVIENSKWQEREKIPLVRDCPSAQAILKKTIADVVRVWKAPVP
jgi:hypothetical protein